MNTEKIEQLKAHRIGIQMAELGRWQEKRELERIDGQIAMLENEDLRASIAELEQALATPAFEAVPEADMTATLVHWMTYDGLPDGHVLMRPVAAREEVGSE